MEGRRGRTARLRDVAELAGVSVKTVSNVVNGYVHVSDDMRARVQAALDDTGYQPHVTARSLRTGRTGLVGLAVPSLSDAYFAELADAVVTAATDRGWTVLVEQTDGDPAREADVLSGARPSLVDGLLLHPISLDAATFGSLRRRTPVVLLGEHLHGEHTSLAVDGVAAARDLVAHLVATGRQRIACVGTRPGASRGTAAQRLAGYRQALAEAGLTAPAGYEVPVMQWRRPDGADAARRLLALDAWPDAVFCFSDALALGVLRALHDEGVTVPTDVAVAGFDDITEARYAIPSLTTIAPDTAELARMALTLLAAELGDDPDGAHGSPHGSPRTGSSPDSMITVPHRLVPRESTAP
jgi:DNA-binding LacI/PurR family transcriptional regulator